MKAFRLLTYIAIVAPMIASSEEVLVRTPSGDSITIDIETEQAFSEVIEQIEVIVNGTEQVENTSTFKWILDFMTGSDTSMSTSAHAKPRDYYRPVTTSERDDINYLIKTLATGSWTSLLGAKSSLETAGDHIDNLHPLRFLTILFTDSKLQSGVHAIRDRKKIWKEFSSGLTSSLDQENKADNLKMEHIEDFAKNVKLDVALIRTPLQQKRWSDFIDILLTKIPREGDPGRYDMFVR